MTEISCFIGLSDYNKIFQFSRYPDSEIVKTLQNFKITILRVSVSGHVEIARLSEDDQVFWEDLP